MNVEQTTRGNTLAVITFILNLYMIVGGLLLFTGGFHAVDNSYNILKLSYENGTDYYITYVDTNLLGQPITFEDLYRLGWKMVIFGMLLIFAGSVGFGYSLIYVRGRDNEQRGRREKAKRI